MKVEYCRFGFQLRNPDIQRRLPGAAVAEQPATSCYLLNCGLESAEQQM